MLKNITLILFGFFCILIVHPIYGEEKKETNFSMEKGLVFTPSSTSNSKTTSSEISKIQDFAVFIPLSNSLCLSNNPWALGQTRLVEDQVLTEKDCFSLQLSVNEDGYVFLFSHADNGKTFRLFPNSCNALGNISNRLSANKILSLPKNSKNELMAIGLDETTGKEHLYAIIVKTKKTQLALLDLIEEIPDVCNSEADQKFSANYLQTQFTNFKKVYSTEFEWTSFRFNHQ